VADRPKLTISVLTKNETHQIRRCLQSAAFADEILVIDNGSMDDTVDIARSMSAVVHVYPQWHGFAVQRNYQLQHATGEYLMLLDSDEEITPELREEILSVVQAGSDQLHGFPALEIAYGHELRHMRARTLGNRFFKRSLVERFEGIVHEGPVTTQPASSTVFKNKLRHYSRTSVHGSLRKLAQYAMLGAAKRKDDPKQGGVLRGLGSALASFISNYVFRLGFTGGGAGFLFCLFISLEGFFRYAALRYDRASLRDDVQR
jgi:glycosyltransferase involved in cell wall biosynthesis